MNLKLIEVQQKLTAEIVPRLTNGLHKANADCAAAKHSLYQLEIEEAEKLTDASIKINSLDVMMAN